MSKISLIAKLTAADDKAAELESALHGIVSAADEEDGLEIYSAHRADDGVYYFFELYRDADALSAHGSGERMQAAMGGLGGLLAGRPEIITMQPVVAKGMAV